MGWLYNKLTPNKTIQLKDFKQDKVNAFVNQVIQQAKETTPEVAPETKTETEKPETETKETLNAMRFTVPSVNYTSSNDKERRTIGYNVPPQNATQMQTQTTNHVPDVRNVIETETITHVPPKQVMYRHSDIRIIKVEDTTFCAYCNKEFKATTKRARFCSSTCRVKNHKEKNK
jgi:hypothetical protein